MIPNLSKLRCLDGLPTDVQPSPGLSEEVFQELGEEIIDYLDIPDLVRALALNKLASSRARTVLQSKLPILTVLMDPPFALNFSQIVSLETLDLSVVLRQQPGSITNMARFAAAISIGALPLLRELDLSNNEFGKEGMEAFSEAIGKGALPLLRKLDLSNNEFGDEGMKFFSEAIGNKALPLLEVLTLVRCNFGYEGMKFFSEAISNETLQNLISLDITSNPIPSYSNWSVLFDNIKTVLRALKRFDHSINEEHYYEYSPDQGWTWKPSPATYRIVPIAFFVP